MLQLAQTFDDGSQAGGVAGLEVQLDLPEVVGSGMQLVRDLPLSNDDGGGVRPTGRLARVGGSQEVG
jgi:hypothetical protein